MILQWKIAILSQILPFQFDAYVYAFMYTVYILLLLSRAYSFTTVSYYLSCIRIYHMLFGSHFTKRKHSKGLYYITLKYCIQPPR